ncbi:MAG: hypothetical protein ACK4GQ_00230 [Candidatus Hadarchaeales archaeon]
MKVLIQGLGTSPIPIELTLKHEKPDVCYIICSDYQLNYKNEERTNKEILTEAARKTKTNLIFKRCDVFDPRSIRNVLIEILRKIDLRKNELVFNYTSGSAPVRLFLGVFGASISKFAKKTKVIYSISYRDDGVEVVNNHASKLRELLPTEIDLLMDLCSIKPEKKRQK